MAVPFGHAGKFNDFDVAIIEGESGLLSGIEVGQSMSALLKGMPMILISQGLSPSDLERSKWPLAIKEFIHKTFGADLIFDAALAATA